MSKPTVATLSAEIVELRAELEVLRSMHAELDARMAAQPARPAQAAKPVVAKKVEGDPKGRTPSLFARDACYALRNVLSRKVWVQPQGDTFTITAGFETAQGPFTGAELLAFVGRVRADAVPMAA